MIFYLLWAVILPATGSELAQFYAPVGGTVYLFPRSIITPEHRTSWNLGTTTSKIAERGPGSNATYNGRCAGGKCELFSNGTLRMDQLARADNGTFSVNAQLGSITLMEEVRLSVYYLLNSPTITASSNIRPVNGSNLTLTCNGGSQVVHNIYFYRNEELVTCEEPHLSCNSTSTVLKFSPILDTDSGNYSCIISNPVSQNISSFLTLNVAVHVSKVTLTNNATRPVTVDKDSVALTCSSYGTDLHYYWTLMGSPLPQNPRYNFTDNNATLLISPVTRNDQGEFNCAVSNYLNSGWSNPLNLTWSPDGQITCDAQRLNQNIRLYCSWPGGYPPARVHMTHHNWSLSETERIITEVPSHQFAFGAPLFCNGTQLGYSQTCSLVADVPQSPGFINDSVRSGGEGNSVFLSVSLSNGRAGQRLAGHFPAKFSWFKLNPNPTELFTGDNITIISDGYSSFLIVQHMTQEMIGHYMCSAVNPLGSNSFTFILNMTMVEQVASKDVLTAGAIAGIVIGSVAVLAIIALTLVLLFLNKLKASKTDHATGSLNISTHAPANTYERTKDVDQPVPDNEQVDRVLPHPVQMANQWNHTRLNDSSGIIAEEQLGWRGKDRGPHRPGQVVNTQEPTYVTTISNTSSVKEGPIYEDL